MEPHPTDAALTALTDDLDRDVGRRHDHDAVERSWDRSDIRVALDALDAAAFGLIGNTSYREVLSLRKIAFAGCAELRDTPATAIRRP